MRETCQGTAGSGSWESRGLLTLDLLAESSEVVDCVRSRGGRGRHLCYKSMTWFSSMDFEVGFEERWVVGYMHLRGETRVSTDVEHEIRQNLEKESKV